MYITETLFKRDLLGNILKWYCKVERNVDENEIPYIRLAYHYGKLNGLETISYSDRIVALSKKTDLEQAIFEMNSVYERHRKKGYKSLSDLKIDSFFKSPNNNDIDILYKLLDKALPKYNTDANNCIKPMKCQKFAIGKFNYPALIQPKINGVRATIMLEEFVPEDLFTLRGIQRNGKYYRSVIKSKEGLEYSIFQINQLFDDIYNSYPEYANVVFDGEIYIRGQKVTTIGGAARNPRHELHSKLQFVNFDLSIPDMNNEDRDNFRYDIFNRYIKDNSSSSYNLCAGHIWDSINPNSHSLWDSFNLIILHSDVCYDDNEALKYMQTCIKEGFEGAVIRDKYAEYGFGSRVKTMMKLKKFEDSEFECIGINHMGNPSDGVGFAVTLKLKNDINDLTFDCTLTGTVEERLKVLNNPPIGKMVTVKFYERTKTGKPFHANIIGIRDYEN